MSRSSSWCGCIIVIIGILLVIYFVGVPFFRAKQTNTPTTNQHKLKFAVITNGQVSDPFWATVKQGIDQAATKLNVTTTYQAPSFYSISTMSQLIDEAVATKPSGLVVSIPNCTGLTPAIKRAQLVGIPVISINSGSDCASTLGLLNHVGQTNYQIGLEAGHKLVSAGAKHVLCVSQNVTTDLDDRCGGIEDALTQAGGKSEVLAIDLHNSITTQQTIRARLTQDASIDAVMTLNSASAPLALAAIQQSNHLNPITLATFDVTPTILQAIKLNNILFAIDQKQFIQGYLPIELLTQYKKNSHTGTTSVSTADPEFITKDNVAQVQ